ncbi:MAG: tRNA (adenosine(37)-N6)-threonylcarbamoyltransferase complex dimerization subunit type 1 TsaB [Candidatus Omnitrophica bacterium]|nr:tRNA (adenosine(37)-N6)-threonylcarbamoyltransferase complex dimerization subunit type 1 TsaB [Candidatus Omnitrophota bacterium]MBU1932302.1 tRNA (adenosine(37)-N6)-threonylcarbamoyltransferase complex dimerization subunit type 1 TsaB [Candidatus Omnitrophota bacterium]
MRTLGIDTSSRVLSIALSQDDNIIAEQNRVFEKKHSSFLIPEIKRILEESHVSIKEVDGFIIGLGPGSFTGLRIGVSAVKGFGVATQKPCVGVPSIDALAFNVDVAAESIVPVIDAKRGQVYSAIYKKRRGQVVRSTDFLLLTIDKLIKKIKGPAVFLGDGLNLYRRDIEKSKKDSIFLEEEYWYPRAGNLIKLAVGKHKISKKLALGKLKPIYIYPKDCQVKK